MRIQENNIDQLKNGFVQRLLAAMSEKRYNKTELANEMGVPVSTVTAHTNGSFIPSFLYTLKRYSEVLGISIDFLVKGEEPAKMNISQLREFLNDIEIEASDITDKEEKEILKLVRKLKSRKPTAWGIIHEVMKMSIETEEDVELVIKRLKEIPNKEIRENILKWFLAD